MKLVVIHGGTKTHAPARDGFVFSGGGIWDRPPHAGTMCGKPTARMATTYYVDEVTPSCMRCQQLMTHWNRKPQA